MAGEVVLIVEDRRENIVHLANNVLKPNGYQVITAMDGQQGLRRIQKDRPDLVIMDLNMPKMDGLEVLAALQEREIGIPVILTTFYGSEQVAQQALSLGAVNYVVKPYEPSEMLQAIEQALVERVPPPPPAPPPPAQPQEMMPLTRQVERWMRDMNILNRVGKALVARLNLESVSTRTVEASIYITRADHAFLFLMETDDAAEPGLCAMRGSSDRRVRFIEEPVESRLAMQVFRSGKMLVRASAAGEDTLVEIAGELLGPVAAAPLRWQGETFGVLIVTRSPGGTAFGESDLEWLGGLTEYAAIAVRNARVCQQRSEAQPATTDNKERLAALQGELERLVTDLEEATNTVRQLAARLAEGGGPEEGPGEVA